MDDFDRKVLRRQWLNQVLSWCIRGSVNGVEYTREKIMSLIEADADDIQAIPEYTALVRMFQKGMSKKSIETYIRAVI